MHKKKYHEMTIEYLSLFVSWVDSLLSLQLHHLLHIKIINPPFSNLVICINQESCLMHQLNINKCIKKQYHEMTMKYLSLFVSWVDSFLSLLLHHLLHSWHHHLLSKCSRWIRGSSRIESFIFLTLEGSSLNCESLIFRLSHLLFSY